MSRYADVPQSPGPPARECGECDLCCTVLRVDDLAKRGGQRCRHQQERGGCGIYATRPGICRAYRCLWLRGGLEEPERPDRLGAVVDLVTEGETTLLAIREAERGAFERSPRLRAIAERYRATLPVRISDVDEVMDPDAPFRLLLPGGEEHRIAGDRVEVWLDGERLDERRLPWIDRWLRRLATRLRARRWRRVESRPPVA